jgi:hypothetical protein
MNVETPKFIHLDHPMDRYTVLPAILVPSFKFLTSIQKTIYLRGRLVLCWPTSNPYLPNCKTERSKLFFGYKSAEGTPEDRECGQPSPLAYFFMAFIYASK